MATVRTAHTADLDPATLRAARALLDAAFAGAFDDSDWEHALGGIHALALEGDELVAHASLVQRRLLYAGRALRTGYVEAVGVRPDRRRRGHGALRHGGARAGDPRRLRRRRAERDRRRRRALHGARVGPLGGPDLRAHRSGLARTEEDDGSVFVLPAGAELDPALPLACDWRDGAPW